MISIRKRGRVYQYCFEAGKVNGKRKQITKSGFRTKNKAFIISLALSLRNSIDIKGIRYIIIKYIKTCMPTLL